MHAMQYIMTKSKDSRVQRVRPREAKEATQGKLLVSALHAGSMTAWVVIIYVHVIAVSHGIGACMMPCINVRQQHLIDHNRLGELLDWRPWRESLFKMGNGGRVYAFRELDSELDIEISRFVMPLRRHALPFDNLDVV